MPSIPKELKGIIPPSRIHKKKVRKKITPSQRTKLKKEFLKEYEKEGMSMNKASKIVGFSRQVIYKWAEADPEFAEKFERIKFSKENKSKKAWDKLHKYDDEAKSLFLELYADDSYSVASTLEEISEKLPREFNTQDTEYWMKTDFEFKKQYKALQQKLRPQLAKGIELRKSILSAKIKERQNKFLEVYTTQHFNITNACKALDIKRSTVMSWCVKDPEFGAALDAAQDEKEDWVEDKLLQLVDEGNMPATIFLSKILLQKARLDRRHAYVEQPQKIEGHISHVHKFDQDQLDAMVRGREIDRSKYAKMLEIDDPNIIDAECINESSN